MKYQSKKQCKCCDIALKSETLIGEFPKNELEKILLSKQESQTPNASEKNASVFRDQNVLNKKMSPVEMEDFTTRWLDGKIFTTGYDIILRLIFHEICYLKIVKEYFPNNSIKLTDILSILNENDSLPLRSSHAWGANSFIIIETRLAFAIINCLSLRCITSFASMSIF